MKTLMMWKQAADQFLEFFRGHGHTIVPSSSLVPVNDPTLLFTNAGMVQFKDTFLGLEPRTYSRAATLQKCMRVQGKHNDLENVGPSPIHHTFFFMLGNFSFGDYFKSEAITYAWELMTRQYRVDPNRLVITVLQGDQEAEAAWRKLGVPDSRILRLTEKTNFWMMGDLGPCGPTSELHFDWGPDRCSCGRSDCSVALDNGCLRWLEAWNLVFMQFDQRPDGGRVPLPKPGVDTGMGLERITSILQGIPDDYLTDIFEPIMNRVYDLIGVGKDPQHMVAGRVMADHARAMTFLMTDGIVPGNEGRGYVLRMIMRRAMRFARSAGFEQPFLGDLADVAIRQMSNLYPDLLNQREFIMAAARNEEERFAQTLSIGLERLEEIIARVRALNADTVPGDEVFRLRDTLGFPVEMTRDVAREHGLAIDEAGFAAALEAQRARSRTAQMFDTPVAEMHFKALADEAITTEFVGYGKYRARAKVRALFVDGKRVDRAPAGSSPEVVLDRTPFYAEAGGQVGDTGTLLGSRVSVDVSDTQQPVSGVIVHRGKVTRGYLRVGSPVTAQVDVVRRADIMRNHTATHLLHKALQEIVGSHARQAGSLVAPDRLRFDFIHLSALSQEQREAIERKVNEQVLEDLPVRAQWMSYDEATKLGAMALFGEKYGDRVRVISIDGYSRELCGGTHVKRTGQIGTFKVTSEGGVAAGVRRIEAVTGHGTYAILRKQESLLATMAEYLRTSPEEVPERVRRLTERIKQFEKKSAEETLADFREKRFNEMLDRALLLDNNTFLVETVNARPEVMRSIADFTLERLEQNGQRGVVVLASDSNGQVVASRSEGVEIDVGTLVRDLTSEFGGSGGGRPDFAQGGLKDPSRIKDLIARGRSKEFLRPYITRLA